MILLSCCRLWDSWGVSLLTRKMMELKCWLWRYLMQLCFYYHLKLIWFNLEYRYLCLVFCSCNLSSLLGCILFRGGPRIWDLAIQLFQRMKKSFLAAAVCFTVPIAGDRSCLVAGSWRLPWRYSSLPPAERGKDTARWEGGSGIGMDRAGT